MPKVAITGAHGYVGSQLVNFFMYHGWDVVALSRTKPEIVVTEWVSYDLEHPPASSFFSSRPVDVLIHAAYDFKPRSWTDIERINLKGSNALLTAAHQGGVKTLIFISSLSAFQGCVSMYGRCKLAIEQTALALGAAAVRPGLIHGASPVGTMRGLMQQATTKRWIPVIYDPHRSLRLTHEDDLCRLCFDLASGRFPIPTRAMIAAAPGAWSLKSIIETLAARTRRQVTVLPMPWWFFWAGLKLFETIGTTLPFRSDSVLTLAYPAKRIDADADWVPQVQFREFS